MVVAGARAGRERVALAPAPAGRELVVLAGAGRDALVVIEALDAQVGGAVGGFEARIAVVRREFPRGDDEDLNVRVPRDGPGGWPPDLNVRVPADDPGGLLPGLAVWSGAANGATHGAGAARAAEVRRNLVDPRGGVHAGGIGGFFETRGGNLEDYPPHGFMVPPVPDLGLSPGQIPPQDRSSSFP